MGFEHTVSRTERLARVVGSGDLDFGMCIATIGALAADLKGEQGFGILIDVRDSDYLGSASEVRKYAAAVNEALSLRGHRLALVVKSSVQFGMARMFCSYLQMLGGEADVFREIEPAMAWLTGAQRK